MIVAEAERVQATTLTYLVGREDIAREVLHEIEVYRDLRAEGDDRARVEQRTKIMRMLIEAGGNAGQHIDEAAADRWAEIMAARAQAARVGGQIAVYRAAPKLYRQRQIMRALEDIASRRKFVIGIDPSRVNIHVDLEEISPLFNFSQQNQSGNDGS